MSYPSQIEILPCNGPINGSMRPPGSKSITNRALILAALADGPSKLSGVLDSDDTQVMIESLRRLGLKIDQNLEKCEVLIEGQRQFPNDKAELYLKNSGTSIRFLTAAVASQNGAFELDGNERMQKRPIGDLGDALKALGVKVDYQKETGYPPLSVRSKGLHGGPVAVASSKSSQFLSGLLMAAPLAKEEVQLLLDGPLVSRPYVDMTISLMKSFGVHVDESQKAFKIAPQNYRSRNFEIEPDASGASYFFALAAVTGGRITVEGLNQNSLQSDIGFVEALRQMGCDVQYEENSTTVIGQPLKGITIDMNQISDTAQTLAVVALFAEGPTKIHNIKHNRYKETDRISDLRTELERLGAEVNEFDDGLEIHPPKKGQSLQACTIETYDDHRMAMSLALAGLKVPGVVIDNPACVAKTFPTYFQVLNRLGIKTMNLR